MPGSSNVWGEAPTPRSEHRHPWLSWRYFSDPSDQPRARAACRVRLTEKGYPGPGLWIMGATGQDTDSWISIANICSSGITLDVGLLGCIFRGSLNSPASTTSAQGLPAKCCRVSPCYSWLGFGVRFHNHKDWPEYPCHTSPASAGPITLPISSSIIQQLHGPRLQWLL